MSKDEANRIGIRKVLILFAAWVWLPLWLCGCLSMNDGMDAPTVSKGHYMDEGATIIVDDPYYAGDEEGLTLLEELQQVSDNLEVECEKNALLNQQLLTMCDARDQIKGEFDQTRTERIRLSEQVAALKMDLAERESKIDQIIRENKDILERLINLKIEKNNVEKELLKIKIAAFSGDG